MMDLDLKQFEVEEYLENRAIVLKLKEINGKKSYHIKAEKHAIDTTFTM
jgi:hypothetical protein